MHFRGDFLFIYFFFLCVFVFISACTTQLVIYVFNSYFSIDLPCLFIIWMYILSG